MPLCLLLLTSCATQKMFTTLDILRPAEITFAPGVSRVVIVNNAALQPHHLGHTSGGTAVSETVPFDSAALFCNASLRETLEDKAFFSEVAMDQTHQNTSGDFYKITPLTPDQVRALAGRYNADAVISLDHIITKNDKSAFYSDDGNLQHALDVSVTTTWSVRYPAGVSVETKQFTDEFSWENNSENGLPSRYNALVDACILTGSNVAERMVPRWEKQDRYFYAPKKALMQQAMDSVTHRNWRGAIALWQQAAEEYRQQIMKYRIFSNIAIAYEIMGDMDNALGYAQKALDVYTDTMAFLLIDSNDIFTLINYVDFLKKRKAEIEQIKIQLSDTAP